MLGMWVYLSFGDLDINGADDEGFDDRVLLGSERGLVIVEGGLRSGTRAVRKAEQDRWIAQVQLVPSSTVLQLPDTFSSYSQRTRCFVRISI